MNAEELAALGNEWYVNRNTGLKRKKMPLDGTFVVLNTVSGGFYFRHFTDEDEAVAYARSQNGSKVGGSDGAEVIRAFQLREVEADYRWEKRDQPSAGPGD
jgi:hypothetical protein